MSAINNSLDGGTTAKLAAHSDGDLFNLSQRQAKTPCSHGCCAEEDGYKRLILKELDRRKVKIGWLEPKTKVSRSNLNRILRGNYRLNDELRHKCFVALSIDPHQAYITVAMLGDVDAYHSPETHFIAQNLIAVQQDVCDARRGKITGFFKPAIITQAAKNGVDSILNHQKAIEEKEHEFIGSSASFS
ncbi:hypothetical protein [Sphingorhabdus sp.]|uniref:hypothetical protein n=1 Tax=Sphingorhabdus sp. TaxID=1902408 RepID=UPI003C712C88